MSKFSQQTVDTLRSTVDAACSDPLHELPGATVVVVRRDGKELFAHAAGRRGVASLEDMTLDTVFWIASCTKLVTGIACMQLVEKGQLRLDDGEQIENLCPELKGLQVLRKDGALEHKKKRITLRMLLSHTAGFGYSFFNERLRDWGYPAGIDEFNGRQEEMISPLLFQPGEGWEYGIGVDWAGIALERITGVTLNDYMVKNIFEPLGIKDMSMFPSPKMKANLAFMQQRSPDGSLRSRDHLMRTPLVVQRGEDISRCFNSGGAGLFARPQEYCKILAALLNQGKSPTTGAEILKPSTVAEMFENHISDFPNFGRQSIPAAKPDLTNNVPDLYPVSGDPPQGWGLTFMLSNGGSTGRSTKTANWAGLANLFWWCDPEHGIAGMVATQILPFCDAKVLKLWADIETEAYAGLRDADSTK
ncbi:beta-lactamase/transpeptidase-like protein [Cryphonectria parasitica EP155]|uniref:Beta-lactamase/transpeptidase-like protein n=1 Tax=Cryphonectria parasitica (strain ATCC 38755 / EP155) TaxID=660469 RepID=A0A9P4XX05_CRYP1|nr:beta-lactamase/transpeptidase-like protein [Cryphonectria parasitica EP155]KAF3762892.1 beta-lactamase/transpeptidase-like protein [Cryphonectria parasitica EP155]